MNAPSTTTDQIWLVILLLGLGTFSLRLSFIQLQAWIDQFPPRLERSLVFIPPAILAALVFPELLTFEGTVTTLFLDARFLAGALSTVVAWRTGNMLATITVGMVVLWVSTPLVG